MASKLSRGQKIAIAVFVSLVVIGLFSALVWWHFSDDENTCVGFDCTNSPNSLNANPAGVTCQADPCLATECCTTVPTPVPTPEPAPDSSVEVVASDSTNSPCNLSTLTQPTNGSWGTICPSNSGEIQHGASCDLGCNTGYTPSNQPTCNNGVLLSTTLTCTAEDSTSDSTSGDDCTTPEPVPPGYNLTNVTGSPSKSSFTITGVECATGYTGTATAAACSVANGAYTLDGCSVDGCYDLTIGGLRNCGTNAVCEDNDPPDPSYTCRCAPGYTGPSRHGGRINCLPIQDNIDHPRTCADTDADGSMNNFDCTDSPNSLDLSPADIDCSGDACTAPECCTVQNISEPPYYLGDNLESCTATCARYGKTCEASGWEYNPNIYGDDASRSGATTDNILPASFLSQLNCNIYRNESSKGAPYIFISTDSDDITCNYLNNTGRRRREGGDDDAEELCSYVQDAWTTIIEKRICKCV